MQGRTVVITGGAGGLGLEVTAACVEAGAKVIVTSHSQDRSDVLEQRLGAGHAVRCAQVDLRDEDAGHAFFASVPRVDALVHLVGGFGMGELTEFAWQDYQRLVALNLTTTFVAIKAVLPKMRAAGYGRIVTVASRSALEPAAGMSVYSATKAAVLAFTQAIAEECREVDITANSVLPTVIDTPANRAAMGDAEAASWVSPRRLAASIRFLASQQARDVRGTAMRVYGSV